MDYSLILEQIKNVKDANGHEALLKSLVDQLDPQDFEQLVQDSTVDSTGDNEKALKAVARLCLSLCYKYGIGRNASVEDSIRWLINSSRLGNPMAQFILAECYRRGESVNQDIIKAKDWYAKAAEHEYANSRLRAESDPVMLGLRSQGAYGIDGDYLYCGYLAKYDIGKDIQSYDPEGAFRYFKESANEGYPPAITELGLCFYYGDGISKDEAHAFQLFSTAAELGDTEGLYYLGECYDFGRGTEKDILKAIECYTKAAEQGDRYAQFNLAFCYSEGYGVDLDYEKAVYGMVNRLNKGLIKHNVTLENAI